GADRFDQRLHLCQMALSRGGYALYPLSGWHVSALPGRADPAGDDAAGLWSLWQTDWLDPGALYFWHSDHGAALPRLLWRHPQRVARCGQNRRLRLFWHLPLDLAADLHARVCRGAALAIYLDLE